MAFALFALIFHPARRGFLFRHIFNHRINGKSTRPDSIRGLLAADSRIISF